MSIKDWYENIYRTGYGTIYPESHVIRFYEHFLKNRCTETANRQRLLDFGCGNGTHPLYFASKGCEVYGVDVSETAISLARTKFPEAGENFVVIEPEQDIDRLFDGGYDVIIANQSLYYLSDSGLAKTLRQMYTLLKDDGVVFFTMMGTKNYYYGLSGEECHDGLKTVHLPERIGGSVSINFTDSEDELVHKLQPFHPDFIGYYDWASPEGSTFHYYFVGRK